MGSFLVHPATKAVLSFLSKNWKELLLLCFFVALVGKSRMDYLRLESAYETSQQSLQSQITNLKESHANELRLRDESIQRYKDTLQKIESEYQANKEKIDEDVVEERKEIAREIVTRNQLSINKSELAEKVIQNFGFQYVE